MILNKRVEIKGLMLAIFVAIIIIAVVACKPMVVEQINVSGESINSNLSTEPNPGPIMTPKQKALELLQLDPTAEIDDALIPLLIKMKSAKSTTFNYSQDNSDQDSFKYFVAGRDFKVVLPETRNLAGINNSEFDVVFCDRVTETCYTYCTEDICSEKDLMANKIDYEYFEIKFPTEYLNSLTKAKIVEETTYGKFDVVVVEFESPSSNGRMFMQSYSGFPLKIFIESQNTTDVIEFKEFMFDNVKLKDVLIPSKVVLEDFYGKGDYITLLGSQLSQADERNFETVVAKAKGIKYSEARELLEEKGIDVVWDEITKIDQEATNKLTQTQVIQ
ncbi:hypothetical protein HN587_00215 [Candidatus Woesearchaeota archaeon]|jgi:hypothetical protein|nr:hypothetical protein [Candidatus Woesearchaeota archaeon]